MANQKVKSIIGYLLSAQDGGGHFFEEAPDSIFCLICDSCIQPYVPQKIDLKNVGLDACYTYDHRPIVSQKFKDFCGRHGWEDIDFIRVNESPKLYLFMPQQVIAFDTEARETSFTEYCNRCQAYGSVAGATPAFLKQTSKINNGFFRSDVEFGSGREKFPLIIVGINTYELLKKEKLKGLYFNKINRKSIGSESLIVK